MIHTYSKKKRKLWLAWGEKKKKIGHTSLWNSHFLGILQIGKQEKGAWVNLRRPQLGLGEGGGIFSQKLEEEKGALDAVQSCAIKKSRRFIGKNKSKNSLKLRWNGEKIQQQRSVR